MPKDKRDDVYNRLSNLMHATSEDMFDGMYGELLHVYQRHMITSSDMSPMVGVVAHVCGKAVGQGLVVYFHTGM